MPYFDPDASEQSISGTGDCSSFQQFQVKDLLDPNGFTTETTADFAVTDGSDITWDDVQLKIIGFFKLAGAPKLDIDHIETVQVIQDVANHYAMVAGKSTAVRVFLKSTGTNATDIRAGITGTLTADEFPNDIRHPINTDAIAPAAGPDESNPRHSLNFILPPSWTNPRNGALHLHVTAKSANGPNVPKDLPVTKFYTLPNWPKTFRVRYVEVCAPDSRGNNQCPTAPPDDLASDLMQKIYPITDQGLDYGWLFSPQIQWPSRLGFDDSDLPATKADALLSQLKLTIFLKKLYLRLETLDPTQPINQLFAWTPLQNGALGLQQYYSFTSGFGHVW